MDQQIERVTGRPEPSLAAVGGRINRILPAALREQGWTIWHFVGAVGLAVVGMVLTWDVWKDVMHIASTHEESSHILLVALAAPWIVWARIHRLRHCAPSGLWIGPLVVLIGAFSMIYGYDNHYLNTLWRGGALLVVIGCMLTFLGREVLWRFLPAFVVLAFVLPMPGTVQRMIAVPLQTAMATMAEHISLLLGFPLERSGNVLYVGGQHVEVAEACNGMRMVFALFLVSFTFAFVSPLRWYAKLLVLATAPLLALAGNAVRLVPTVFVYAYAPAGWGDAFHDVGGWAMVPVAVMLLFGALWLLEWLGVRVWLTSEDRKQKRREAPRWRLGASDHPLRSTLWAALAALAVLVGLGERVQARQMPDDAVAYHAALAEAAAELPEVIGGEWLARDQEVPRYAQELLQPNVLVSRRYVNVRTGQEVQMTLVQTRDARDMVFHWPPECYPYIGWTQQWSEQRAWYATGRELPVMEYGFLVGAFDDRREVVVSNLMLLPTGELTPHMDAVIAASNQPQQRFYGAGQIQIIFSEQMDSEERREIFELFLEAYGGVIEKMKKGGEREP